MKQEDAIIAVRDTVQELLDDLNFDGSVIVKQRGNAYLVDINSESPGQIIGQHGDVLGSLQHIVKVILIKKELLGDLNLVIDVNGYRSKRLSSIEREAKEAAKRVSSSGKAESLAPMNSFERKSVHEIISTFENLSSESIGTGEERKVVIKPKE